MTLVVFSKGRGVGATARGVIALLLLAVASNVQATGSAVVFQSTETPPFWTASLPENGLAGSLLNLLSVAAGVPYSIEYLPVKRFRHSLATYVVGDPDILVNQKRRAIFPLYLFSSAFFFYKPHHDVIEFHGIGDLKGHTLGVLRGTLEDKDYFLNKGVKVEESDSVESLIKKLKRGRIDFCILVSATGLYTIKQVFPEEQGDFGQVAIPGSVRPIAIMIDVDVPEGKAVAQRYQKVLNSTLHSKKYHDILEDFYGKDNTPADRFEHLEKFEQYYAIDLND